jgi:SpoU rRNA methylase family enzyme
VGEQSRVRREVVARQSYALARARVIMNRDVGESAFTGAPRVLRNEERRGLAVSVLPRDEVFVVLPE